MNDKILICIFNYRHDENAKRWLHLLSPYFGTVVLDSGNDHIEKEFIQFPNIYYSGLFNEMKRLSEKKDYVFIGQICSDVEIDDSNAELLIKVLNNICEYDKVGILQPGVTNDSRKGWSKSSMTLKNCFISANMIEGWMHFIRKEILDEINYIDVNKNLYGYGIDIYESIKSSEMRYLNIIDAFIEVKNPDGTGYNSTEACIQGDKYIQEVTKTYHKLKYYTRGYYRYKIITKDKLKRVELNDVVINTKSKPVINTSNLQNTIQNRKKKSKLEQLKEDIKNGKVTRVNTGSGWNWKRVNEL